LCSQAHDDDDDDTKNTQQDAYNKDEATRSHLSKKEQFRIQSGLSEEWLKSHSAELVLHGPVPPHAYINYV
jgi:hypothetical protein